MEIAVLNHRGLGNGWLLPAGPLREPRSRLDHVDAIVLNGDVPEVAAAAPRYRMQTRLASAYALHAPNLRIELSSLAAEQRAHGWRLIAAAGIGAPERFFAMLRAGAGIDALPLADYFNYAENPFLNRAADRILITEKDAVKCRANSSLASDGLWVVPLQVIDDALVDCVVLLKAVAAEEPDGLRLLDLLVCPVCKGLLEYRPRTPGADLRSAGAGLSDSRRHPGDARGRCAQARPR